MFTNLKLNILSACSIIGIWPRFIEPKLLTTTKLDIILPNVQKSLNGLKILQISDLHFHRHFSRAFANRIIKKSGELAPDIIVFTGDFICHGIVEDRNRLKNFLQQFYAPYGCYAVLGNHDYHGYVSVNQHGDYDVIQSQNKSSLLRAFGRLFCSLTLTGHTTAQAKMLPLNQELIDLLTETSITVLHNQTTTIPIKDGYLNLTGLGEYSLGRCDPNKAFEGRSMDPGIILMHNPDGTPLLKNFPGDIILCGHTHGGQINLPLIWKKLTLLENPQFKKGLLKVDQKWMYINRGLGGVLPFRLFSPPELLLLTLKI